MIGVGSFLVTKFCWVWLTFLLSIFHTTPFPPEEYLFPNQLKSDRCRTQPGEKFSRNTQGLAGEASYGDSQSTTPNLSVVSDNQYENCGREEQTAMIRRREKLRQIPPDWELWQKLYYKHPQAYLRQRLLAIKYVWDGKSRPEVAQLLNCNYQSLTKWIDKFLEGGLQKLTEPITHQVPSRLQPEQQLELKKMLLERKPSDYGIDRYIWTGKIISQVIQSRWGVTLKETRIYEIIEQLNLSHQKAHRDYANADKSLQQQFVETLKKNSKPSSTGKK